MLVLVFLALFPIVLGGLAIWLRPDLLFGEKVMLPDATWSYLSNYLGYLGVVFSLYALIEVKRLSVRYFAKQRLPEIKKDIGKVRGQMDDLAQKQLKEIRSESFVGRTRVLVKQLEKTKSPGFPEVVKRAKKVLASVDSKVKEAHNDEMLVNDLPEFWELYKTLSELSDEIDAFSKNSEAKV